MNTAITTYFLFGQEAADIYLNNEFDELLEDIEDLHFTICKHSSNDNALDLLEAYDGWGGYAIINQDEYEILKEKINLHNLK
jgi:hypothetical protein